MQFVKAFIIFAVVSMIPAFAVAAPYVVPTTLRDVINHLGIGANLQLALDASDSASYGGSGQTWTDRSGGGYNFVLGATSSSESSDPTFNGVAGNQSKNEYFSVDGGDYFTLGQSNPTWVNALHKAGTAFTIAEWVYVNGATSVSVNFGEIGDLGSGLDFTGIGFGASADTLRAVQLEIGNVSADIYDRSSSATVNNNTWNFLAVSFDIAAGNVTFQVNGTTESHTSQTFSGTPTTNNAISKLQVAALGANIFPDANGVRHSQVAMWSAGLSGDQLAALYSATRARFGV